MPTSLSDRVVLSPDDDEWGRAFIAYMLSDANAHTSYLGANLKFVGSHPEEKLRLTAQQGIGVITLLNGQKPFLTRKISNYTFGLAFYATSDLFARQLRLQAGWALESCDYQAFNLAMNGQKVLFMIPDFPIGPLPDKTGLRVTELSVKVRLST